MNAIAKSGVMVLIAAGVLVGSLAASMAEEPQPEMVIPKMRHDFGQVFERETYEYSFIVQNRGKADLVIENVKPG
jgi:hypothetical protein